MLIYISSIVLLLNSILIPISYSASTNETTKSDIDLLEFALNLEYLEAEFFLFGATGYGLDVVAPGLAQGGPPPIGARIAFLDPFTKDVILQFGLQEIGHLRVIKSVVKGFPRPLLNISRESIAQVMDNAFGKTLRPSFDAYANSINYLLASYLIPYVGLTGYVGASPNLQDPTFKKLVASLLGIEAGQDAVIRSLLYERRKLRVLPYRATVEEFTNRISMLRNRLGNDGIKDEGLEVPIMQGAEGKIIGNILAGDENSTSYPRTPDEILRIIYGGNESVPGGFYPKGAGGNIAKSYLNTRTT